VTVTGTVGVTVRAIRPPLQGAQRLGEHLLAHSGQPTGQLGVAHRPRFADAVGAGAGPVAAEGGKDQRDPLIGDPSEQLTRNVPSGAW
jgi:hypothetical protein